MSAENDKAEQAKRARKLSDEIDRLVESGKSSGAAAPKPRTPRDLAEQGAEKARKQADKDKAGS